MVEPKVARETKKTRVYVLAGFLGAGKTTLLNRMLSWDGALRGTVVLVNEFGELGIDGLLVEAAGSGVFEMTGGCICCTLKMSLQQTLQMIQSKYRPERVIIEATGVADPAAVIEAIQGPALQHAMEMGKVITVLEPEFWEQREQLGGFFHSQLENADLILLNKVDTLKPEKVLHTLHEILECYLDSRVIPTVRCNVDRESIWPDHAEFPFTERAVDLPPDALIGPCSGPRSHHDHSLQDHCGEEHQAEALGFVSFSFQESAPMDEGCFRRFTEALPRNLFRMKGLIRFRDRTVMLNYVGGKGESHEWPDPEATRLSFVGLKVDPDAILGKIRECLCSDSSRTLG